MARFKTFTVLNLKNGAVVGSSDFYINTTQVVCVRVLDITHPDAPAWKIPGMDAPDKVYAVRFTAGDDLLVLEDPWE